MAASRQRRGNRSASRCGTMLAAELGAPTFGSAVEPADEDAEAGRRRTRGWLGGACFALVPATRVATRRVVEAS